MKNEKNYYLGLDIGTNSIGYAVTDEQYNLLKFHGEPAWGVNLFDEVSPNEERRSFRTSRRRLDRRQNRVLMVQELFASEISKVDEKFFVRLRESALYRSDVDDNFILFNDKDFSDRDYYQSYPTIHHLIDDLMNSNKPHDVRLVYLACAWLVKHRGHFLNNLDSSNLSEITNFDVVYNKFTAYFLNNEYDTPWSECDPAEIGKILKRKQTVSNKQKALMNYIYNGKKPPKETSESFPFNREIIIKLLSGSTCKVKDLFVNDDYKELGSFALSDDEEKFAELIDSIGDDYELIDVMRGLWDWSVLVDALDGCDTISQAMIQRYENHRKDLKILKKFINKYMGKKEYDAMFRDHDKDNYVAYTHHSDNEGKITTKKIDDFSKFTLSLVKKIQPLPEDRVEYDDMINRLDLRTFMPKQKNTDNRVIPHQLYLYELRCILRNAEAYLPFLSEKSDSLTVSEKIESIFLFRIPYFVGPLNKNSDYAWLERKPGKIYPWNFEEKVDLAASEEAFIQRMLNTCTYLPGEYVLPKCSITYQKFMVLNAINTLRINGNKITVELKQRIFNELFLKQKKITKKKITDFLIRNGYIEKGEENTVTGVDTTINAGCTSRIDFRRIIDNGILSSEQVEKIIERSTFAEDKKRLAKWLDNEHPNLSQDDKKYICSVKCKDFGRLSRTFLCELEGVNKKTGEVTTILHEMWETQNNLNELLSDRYTFAEQIKEFQNNYYSEHPILLSDRLDEMYVTNSAKRSVFRTLDVVKDITKAFGEPTKIFVETTRSSDVNQQGKRTKSRKEQILELYSKCNNEDIPNLKEQLEEMGAMADQKLRVDKLFLYYMQLGKCAYSGEHIEIDQLFTDKYNIDHIYPQAYVKDDSILNNKVLCLSTENGTKSDAYPISSEIRTKMTGFWRYLKECGLMGDEKYKRLTRATPFTADEKLTFINRQLTETSQSTKTVATILGEKYKNSEIVYCKAHLTSEFRQKFDLLKSRTFNDLHHAVDAYLNIVTGNVYNMKFTKRWFDVNSNYSIKAESLFTHTQICNGVTVWDGKNMLDKVKKTAGKNTAHMTKLAYFRQGGLFDQNPVCKSKDLIPLKKGLPTEKYGGYNKPSVMFFIPVRYKAGKKSEIIIMSVEVLFGKQFLSDETFAKEYSYKRLAKILGKEVDEISFPMGMRPWKINTMLLLDGFRVCIAGSGSGGKILVAQPFVPFAANPKWQCYMKRVERMADIIKKNPDYIYDVERDYVTKEQNEELYRLYIDKLENSVYKKRINSPVELLIEGEEKFKLLDIKSQCLAILNIHQIFGRVSGGCNLEAIGGKKLSATTRLSSSVSNWKKYYDDVRIIDVSSSGLWEKESDNILELL